MISMNTRVSVTNLYRTEIIINMSIRNIIVQLKTIMHEMRIIMFFLCGG